MSWILIDSSLAFNSSNVIKSSNKSNRTHLPANHRLREQLHRTVPACLPSLLAADLPQPDRVLQDPHDRGSGQDPEQPGDAGLLRLLQVNPAEDEGDEQASVRGESVARQEAEALFVD